MTSTTPDDDMVRAFLRARGQAGEDIVGGLGEEAWHRSVVPTGWTPAGMVEHLVGAEWRWFQGVVTGRQPRRGRPLVPLPRKVRSDLDRRAAELTAWLDSHVLRTSSQQPTER